jgi:hypothetical protein
MERFLDRTVENFKAVPGAVKYALRREALSRAFYYASIPLSFLSWIHSGYTGFVNERLVDVQEGRPISQIYSQSRVSAMSVEDLDHLRKEHWTSAAILAAAGGASLIVSWRLGRRNP